VIDFELLPVAELEFQAAADWYAERNPTAGDRFVDEVAAAIEAIRRNPEGFGRMHRRYRICMVDGFPYYVAYRISSGVVVIVAIRHASQDQDAWKSR
jgi:plasmid stabilization system protein ParE